jgi:hypothetical protein
MKNATHLKMAMQARKRQETRRKTAQEQDTNEKHAECDHVKKAVKKNSEAESLNI